jgi:hypothetical protein
MEKLEVAPQETMQDLISGFWIARSIYLSCCTVSMLSIIEAVKL